MKIILIGMAGVGKSYIGKMLAKKLKCNFIDVDDSIKEKTGLGTTELLEKVGDEEFLTIEDEAFSIAIQNNDTVFAPGGSIVYCPSFYDNLANFTVVYLKGKKEEIFGRIQKTPRGIVYSSQKPIDELYAEREKLYEKYAHFVVDASGNGEEIAGYICDIMKGNKRNLC